MHFAIKRRFQLFVISLKTTYVAERFMKRHFLSGVRGSFRFVNKVKYRGIGLQMGAVYPACVKKQENNLITTIISYI